MAFIETMVPPCCRGLLIAAGLGPGALLMAQVRVVVNRGQSQEQPCQVVSEARCRLRVEPDTPGAFKPTLSQHLGYQPQWLWTILEEPASGAVVKREPHDDPDSAYFHLPAVKAVTSFHVQVMARDHPETKVVVAFQVHPKLTLSVADAEVLSGRPCELVAARGPVRISTTFSVAGPGGGTLNRDAQGRTFWTPPAVEVPTSLMLMAQDPIAQTDEPRTLQVLPAVMIRARRFATQCHNLVAGNACALTAERRDGAAAHWQWTVLGASGGQIDVNPQGAATYTAPYTSVAFRVYLRATDLNHPADSALWPMDVMPRIPNLPDYYAEVVLPTAQGDGWMAPTPELTLFAVRGEPGAAADPRAPGFERVLLVEDDPAMGALSGTLLAQSGRSFEVFGKKGVQEKTLRFGDRSDEITAMVVRPRGSLPGNPRQIVFAEYDEASRQGTIWAGNPDGTSTLLAGRANAMAVVGRSRRHGVNLGENYIFPCDGRGTQAAIGRITGMAMSADGTVTFTELRTEDDDILGEPGLSDGKGVIRQLAVDGHVTILAGTLAARVPSGQRPTDGRGGAAVLACPSGLVLDPVAGAFYFFDFESLRRVTLEGLVTTLAGPAFTEPMHHLLVLGDQLLVMGHKNALWMLNLRTGTRRRLMAATPLAAKQRWVRMGPLSAVAPLLPTMACAALANPQAMAVNAQGTCIVADGPMLLKIDLSRWAGYAQAVPAAAMAVDPEEEHKDDPPSALAGCTSAPPSHKPL